jgi:hypothetical protein
VDWHLHNKCVGCMKADWANNYCEVITTPRKIWEEGKCWARSENPKWDEEIEQLQTQYQQVRCPGIEEDLIGWLMGTKPPNIREREAILHLPAPVAKSGGSKSGRKRKKPPKFYINPYLC